LTTRDGQGFVGCSRIWRGSDPRCLSGAVGRHLAMAELIPMLRIVRVGR